MLDGCRLSYFTGRQPPMLYALISDIHGNLEALTTAMASIKRARPDAIICLGDVVGYGANPEECAQIIREEADFCLLGNHEAAVTGALEIDYFSEYARVAVEWTIAQLSAATREWLATLPYMSIINNEFQVVHGSLYHPDMFNYVSTVKDARLNFVYMKKQVLFLGHTHQPLTFFNTNPLRYSSAPELKLPAAGKTIVNVGSAGQPRDDNWLAAYVLYDSEKREISWRRLEYDVSATMRKIIAAQLPEALALRLHFGR
ncbi:metallophosphatase family protein [Planctomycetales bacterium]|nr:metallophosphatase family protein [Planctomycetales bacterium]GHT00013.1 metallophosphatase family protein [Planctomycetales bacterium]GHT06225.1 metallophosphatase family protein [Planctomycetales bacterium]GHV19309.1 metallophosphatase family protein [Planctomycetales bacterium]